MTKEERLLLQQDALKQLSNRELLFGKNKVFDSVLQEFLKTALEDHLDEKEKKFDSLKIETQNHQSHSQFYAIKNRGETLVNDLQGKIVGLYDLGMNIQEISDQINELYEVKMSHTAINQVINHNCIIPKIQKWKDRPLSHTYCIVWLDTMMLCHIQNKILYSVLGINKSGKKEVLGIYLSENKNKTKFWTQVFNDLQKRGLKDILIACVNNLSEFKTIQNVYPQTKIQTCVLHQIRNSLKYVVGESQQAFMKDIKTVYQANSLEIAEKNLTKFIDKWGKQYPVLTKLWENNWPTLSTYFAYSTSIQRIIYTMNEMEKYHQQLYKNLNVKKGFYSEIDLLKFVYFTAQDIDKKWTKPIPNWEKVTKELNVKFNDRIIFNK